MPHWLIVVLKWGGLALAAINLIAIIYVAAQDRPASVAEGAPEAIDAPYTGYLIMLFVGVVAAAGGFIFERRGRSRRLR